MRRSNLKILAYVILLAAIVACTIVTYILPSVCPQVKNITILAITVLLEIVSMGYFIVQDIIGSRTVISKYGSLNLFETVDCEEVSAAVFKSLTEDPSAHVIYVDCRGLNSNSIENVKQKLYEELTACKKSLKKFHIKTRLNVRSVYVPAALDIESLYESVFYSTNRFASGINVYIYDMNTANEFFVNRIAARLKKQIDAAQSKSGKPAAAKTIRRTYIVYLTNNCKNAAIGTGLHGQELRAMVRAKIGCDYDFGDEFTIDIKNVLVINDILEDEFHRNSVLAYPPNLLVIYYLKTGEYIKALQILQSFTTTDDRDAKARKQDTKACNYECYLWSDTLHLLNMYNAAYTMCHGLLAQLEKNEAWLEKSEVMLLEAKVLKLQAHIAKHLGAFSGDCAYPLNANWGLVDSNALLEEMMKTDSASDVCAETKRKIAVNNYFACLKRQLDERTFMYNYVREKTPKIKLEDLVALFENTENPDEKLYFAAFNARINPTQSLKVIDDIIEFYVKTENRRKFNAYYVKAEILRIMSKYQSAYEYYLMSSGILDGHQDVNLLDQNYFSLKALEMLGLANGIASRQVREYKARFYTEKGARVDEKVIAEAANERLPRDACTLDTESELEFNDALLRYIDSDTLDKKSLENLLLHNVFIIL